MCLLARFAWPWSCNFHHSSKCCFHDRAVRTPVVNGLFKTCVRPCRIQIKNTHTNDLQIKKSNTCSPCSLKCSFGAYMWGFRQQPIRTSTNGFAVNEMTLACWIPSLRRLGFDQVQNTTFQIRGVLTALLKQSCSNVSMRQGRPPCWWQTRPVRAQAIVKLRVWAQDALPSWTVSFYLNMYWTSGH